MYLHIFIGIAPKQGAANPAPYVVLKGDEYMLEFIGLVVCVIVISLIVDAATSDDVDFEITLGGKKVFEYHKHNEDKKQKCDKKDL